MSFTRALVKIASFSIVIGCFAVPIPASAATDHVRAGFDLFAANKLSASAAEFRVAIAAHPGDAGALRGLGWIDYYNDDAVAALDHWRRSIQAYPGQWQAAGLWSRMLDLENATGRHDLMLAAAKAIIADTHSAPGLKIAATYTVASDLERRGNAKGAAALKAPGVIRDWKVIGPFDNVSKSGYDNAFTPERSLDTAAQVRGKDGHILRWYSLKSIDAGGYCDPGDAVGDTDDNVYYLATAIRSAGNATVQFALTTTGASKMYVGGKPVFADPIYRNRNKADTDPFIVSAELKAGWNTILLKICDADNTSGGFRMRLLTPSGMPAALECNANHVVPGAITADGAPLPAHDVRAGLMGAGGDSFERALLLEYTESSAGDSDAAADEVRSALARFPNSAILHFELSNALLEDSQIDEAVAERKEALRIAPSFLLARIKSLTGNDDSLVAADQLVRAKSLVASNPRSYQARWALSDTYGDAKLKSDAIGAARAAVKLAGGSANIVRLYSLYHDSDRPADADALLKTGLKADPADTALLGQYAGALNSDDKSAEAISVYQQIIAISGPTLSDELSIADCYTALGNVPAAINMLRTAEAQHPQASWAYTSLGDLLKEQGQTKAAIAQYQQAVALDPTAVQLREKLQILEGRKPVVDICIPLKTPDLVALAKSKPSTASAADIIIDEAREVVYPDSATLTRFHSVVRVNNKQGVDTYSVMPLTDPTSTSRGTVEIAKLYKTDGKIEDEMDNSSSRSASFPSLAPGDIIDVTYRVEDCQRGKLAGNFWTTWYFGDRSPSRVSRFGLITPAGMKYRTEQHNGAPAVTERRVGDWRIAEWKALDVPGRRVEKGAVPSPDCMTWIDVSTIDSWSDIVSWYEDLSHPRCMPDAAVRAKAKELTKTAVTEEDKIRAVVTYVSSLQYQSSPFRNSAYVPTEGKQVIRERYGDCKDKAALMVSLLDALQIHADMALLSPRTSGTTRYLPSPRFDHAIARISTKAGPLWVDGTADDLAYGCLPTGDQGVPALIISPDTKDLQEIPALPLEQNRTEQAITGTLTEDGKLSGKFTLTAYGELAWVLRSVFARVPADQQKQLYQVLATTWFGSNAHGDGGSLDQLDNPEKPFGITLNFHIDDSAKSAGDYLLVSMPWEDLVTSGSLDWLSDPDRQTDVELGESRGFHHTTLSIALPAGYAPLDIAPAASKETAWGNYKVECKVEDGVMKAECTDTQTQLRVPRASLAGYAEFLHGLNKATNRVLLLKKVESAAQK